MASVPNDLEVRQVAEQLLINSGNRSQSLYSPYFPRSYNSSNVMSPDQPYVPIYPNPEISLSQSLNTTTSIRPEYVRSEDLFAGHRLNGSMSNVRRFFCLFVTFDFLFISLMWLICIMLVGENILTAFNIEIVHYTMKKSLFDIVMAAICRFTGLLLFYGFLQINHWIIIALSTSGTCAFLISKVFFFDWASSPQPVFQVLLILASFILSWSEAWFFDFRVIPQEVLAHHFFINVPPESDRAPLIQSYVQGLPSRDPTESIGNFYSPMDSPMGSQCGDDDDRCHLYLQHRFSATEEEKIKHEARKTWELALKIINSPEWKKEKEYPNGDLIHAMKYNSKKIFRMTGIVDAPASFIEDEIFKNVGEQAKWNITLTESIRVQIFDSKTDIIYQVSSARGGGALSSRDFVSLRHCDLQANGQFLAWNCFKHPNLPPKKVHIRGENGVGCFSMIPLPDDSNKCVFRWILNTNLKGWIPNSVLEASLANAMVEYIDCIRKRVTELRRNGKLPPLSC